MGVQKRKKGGGRGGKRGRGKKLRIVIELVFSFLKYRLQATFTFTPPWRDREEKGGREKNHSRRKKRKRKKKGERKKKREEMRRRTGIMPNGSRWKRCPKLKRRTAAAWSPQRSAEERLWEKKKKKKKKERMGEGVGARSLLHVCFFA